MEWAGGKRAILAIAFTDIVDSTATGKGLGDEAMNLTWEAHFATSRALIADHAGHWIKNLGDGDLSVFRTVEEALDYALALQTDPGPTILRLRAGIHIGPIDVLPENDIRGEAVNFAARVGGANKGAEIWLSSQAIDHLITLKAERHVDLHWREHPGIELKGLGAYTLWSLGPSGLGRTLSEIAELRRLRELGKTARRQRRVAVSLACLMGIGGAAFGIYRWQTLPALCSAVTIDWVEDSDGRQTKVDKQSNETPVTQDFSLGGEQQPPICSHVSVLVHPLHYPTWGWLVAGQHNWVQGTPWRVSMKGVWLKGESQLEIAAVTSEDEKYVIDTWVPGLPARPNMGSIITVRRK